jgi:hypothetical protein
VPTKTTTADLAPHGYEADGVTPKAPYGYRKDGVPRKSNRGARPGAFGTTSSTTTRASKTDAKRTAALVMFAEIFICTPLAAASKNRFVKKYIGEQHADALAGDALIISMHAEITARGMVEYATDHPGFLSWMDGVEEKATSLTLVYALGQMGKAMAMNHLAPDPAVAEAGRNMVRMRTVQAAQSAQQEAARYGLLDDEDEGQGEHLDAEDLAAVA